MSETLEILLSSKNIFLCIFTMLIIVEKKRRESSKSLSINWLITSFKMFNINIVGVFKKPMLLDTY